VAGGTSTLTWNLVANSAGYVAGMNKAHASTTKFKTELEKAERSQRNLTRTIVSTAAAAAVVRFGVQSVKAYAEAEKAQMKLQEAFRKFPRLADTNITALRALNSELQRKTRFDDDATAAAQATLAQYDLTGQQIAELTPLMQDFAAVTGGEVTDAAGALGKAFLGNTRALKAIGVDFTATGDRAKDFDTIMGALRTKVGGFAEAEGKTASGQLAIMNNAVGDLQESVGEALVPALTQLVGAVTPIVQSFTSLPADVRTGALAVTALGGAALIAVPKIVAMNTALKATETNLMGALGKAGAAGAAIAVVYELGNASAWLSDKMGQGEQSADAWGASLKDGFDPEELQRISGAMQGFAGTSANLSGAIAAFGRGDVAGGLGAIKNGGEEVENFDKALSALAASGQAEYVNRVIQTLGLSAEDAADKLPQTTAALQGFGQESQWAAAQTAKVAAEAAEATEEVKSFAQALKELNAPAADVTRSQIALIESTKALRDGLRESAGSFSLSTKAGIENRQNLIAATEAIMANGAAIQEKTKDQNKARDAVLEERKALIKNIAALTGSREEARKLVDKYLKIPAAAKEAQAAVEDLTGALLSVPASVTVRVAAQSKASKIPGRASGGYISGPGTGTSDSIPARLSNGEYVVRASAVSRYGTGMLHAINTERFAKGGPVRKKGAARKDRDWSVRDALRGDAAVDFDFTAYGSAVERAAAATRDLADADRSVAEARRRANAAGTPAERAQAEADLADAYAAQAAAGKEVAAAERAKTAAKPTAKNILASFKARAAKLDKFRRDLKTLKSWGLSSVILRQILESGIDDGGDMAAALVKDRSVIAELNSTQAAINKDARALNGPGPKTSGAAGGGGSTGSTGTTGSGGTVTVGFSNADRPIVLKVDGEQVWKSLLHLKKAKGGASLGLG
jgi:hypothetical protein